MKQIIYIVFLLFFTHNSVKSQSLLQILERHYEAAGMKYLKEVESLQYKGNYVNHFLKSISKNISENLLKPDFVLTIEKQRGYLLQILDERGEGAYGFFNGKYWKAPCGFPPQEWNPNNSDRRLIQYYLDSEGFLYNWKKKGHKVTKLNDVILEEKNYHRMKLITLENDTLFYYINPKNYLISKMSFMGDLADDKEHPSFTFLKYKKVQNIMIPFKRIYRSRMLDGSYGNRDILIDKIELNPKLDKTIFNLKNRINNSKDQ